jgi:hypothetical protein
VKARPNWSASALVFALLSVSQPAQACRDIEEADLKDLKFANAVVVGRIANYEIVPDQKIRERRKEELAKPDLSEFQRKLWNSNKFFIEDYARFDVIVDEVLLGTAPSTLHVTWDSGTQVEPEAMPPGPYVIALSDPHGLPHDRVTGDREAPTVLHLVCRDAFIFKAESNEAKAVRRILRGQK